MNVKGNAPLPHSLPDSLTAEHIPLAGDQIRSPWVAAFVPTLPSQTIETPHPNTVPRLIVRVSQLTPEQRWPAAYRMWSMQQSWPEYRLEFEDVQWATSELLSALDSMRCELRPVVEDGRWWC